MTLHGPDQDPDYVNHDENPLDIDLSPRRKSPPVKVIIALLLFLTVIVFGIMARGVTVQVYHPAQNLLDDLLQPIEGTKPPEQINFCGDMLVVKKEKMICAASLTKQDCAFKWIDPPPESIVAVKPMIVVGPRRGTFMEIVTMAKCLANQIDVY